MRNFFVSSVLLISFALPAAAETGQAAAVIQSCGAPAADQQGTSPVTNRLERSLTYGNFILHFEPSADGWTFLSGWYDHLPMSESMVESRMPCFQQAMSASGTQQNIGSAVREDPAVRGQIAAPAGDMGTFGIQHLWLMVALIFLVLLLFLIPSARRNSRPKTTVLEKPRYQRRPFLNRFQRSSSTRLDT